MSEAPSRPADLVATLGMYDFPWIAAANDALWRAISTRLAAAGCPAPAVLTRGADLYGLCMNPQLIFGQTCGYPYVSFLHPHVVLVATPIYDFPGCVGPENCSFLVARKSGGPKNLAEFRGARALVNNPDSNSGMNRFRAMVAPIAGGRPFFANVRVSGSHAASLDAIVANRADLASIDCVTFALMQRGRPALMANIQVVARTAMTPGLPFVMSNRLAPTHLQDLRLALVDVLADPQLAPARKTLGLSGMQIVSPADYDRVAELERAAVAAGYPQLA